MDRRCVGQLRRIPKASLNRARHPMHRTHPDSAGLSAGLELLRDRLQERGPLLLIDGLGELAQYGHLVVGQLQRWRHGRLLGRGIDDARHAATARAGYVP
jgi:hypothetical protein